MKKLLFASVLLIASFYAHAQRKKQVQEIKIPMEAGSWEHDTAMVEFITHKGVKAIKGKNGGGFQVFLKNHQFSNGTIEFDVQLIGMGFPGINFRMSEDRKNGDNFYIRSFGKVNPETRTTLQYAALIDGMSMWDLCDEYQSGATIDQEGWNHVKLVVSGKQMRAYVNEMSKPALNIPLLESGRESGGISLSGNVIFSNLVIKPDVTEGLSADTGMLLTDNDTRYLRNWMVTDAMDFPFGKDLIIPLRSMYGKLNASDLPGKNAKWSPIKAESRGVVNVSRLFGHKPDDARRLTWLKITLHSDTTQQRKLHLGFSDEIWFFVNGELLHADKNYFATTSQKSPDGRCTIENCTIELPLKRGENEILVALANYFYGWGIIARLDNTTGISLPK